MKKWNNPELLSLGVENTFDDCFGATVFAPGQNNGTHYCHKTKGDHNPPDNGKPDGQGISHTRSGYCKTHWDKTSEYSKCCCAPASIGPDVPVIS